jgi:hypothetical protein
MNSSTDFAGIGKPILDDPRWGVVERLIASPAFAKSGRLNQFLVFVCSKALAGNADQINEMQVGVHVFGRPMDYNPAEDSIVRSHARLLRKRLEEYFEAEGRTEPYRIRIPKGGYVPYFEERGQEEPGTAGPEPVFYHPPKIAWFSRLRFRFAMFLAAAVATSAIVFALIRHTPRPEDYAARFWNGFCSAVRPTLIVPSDTALVVYEVMTGQGVGLQEYVSQAFRQNAALRGSSPSERAAALSAMPYSNMVDLQFCWQLARAPGIDLSRTSIRAPKDLRAPDLKGSNVILIGARRADPWVQMFDQSNNFQGLYDERGDYILNRAPKGDESSIYVEHKGLNILESYAVISYVPGLAADDRALLIGGTTSAGTEAALNFVLNARAFGTFLKTLSGAARTIPWFEILLRADGLDSRAPGRWEVSAFRRHGP